MNREVKNVMCILVIGAIGLSQACNQNIDLAKVGPVKIVGGSGSKIESTLSGIEAQANFDRVYAMNNDEVVKARIVARAHDPRNASSASTNNTEARSQLAEARQKIAAAQLALDKAKRRTNSM